MNFSHGLGGGQCHRCLPNMLSFFLISSSSFILVLSAHQIPQIASAPAVWGDPAPDYSAIILDNHTRYIYALLFVDDKIASYYEYDMPRVKEKIMKVVQEANNYFIQLKISIVVVDVLQTNRSNLSLVAFQEYRYVRKDVLPYHDFASLMTMKYPGGLAYVGGMCTDLNVMLCGFYPSEPSAMGSILFHEVGHLLGIPHRPSNVSLFVPNCSCTGQEPDTPAGCLKIPGFDHDCTAQQLANVLYKNKCLNTTPLPMKDTLAICGNGVVEPGEQCDCGKVDQCGVFNCVPTTCSYKIHPLWIYLFFFWLVLLTLLITFAVVRRLGYPQPKFLRMFNCFKQPSSSKGFKNFGNKGLGTFPNKSVANFPPKTADPNSIVILLDKPPRSAAATLQRPKVAPPPPPPRATISVGHHSNYYEVPNSVPSSQRDDLSWKFEDFDSDDEGPIYNSYIGKPGVPTCPNYPNFSPINRVTVQFHGSGDTMDTHCGSSSTSSTALSGSATPL